MRLLNVPLERDEGEYAYIAQLILDGIPPYAEAYNMKFPGIYFIYAGILWLFGQTDTAIHFCLLIVNLLSIILLFIFARKMYDSWVGVAAAGAYALLSISYHVQGFWANAEHFIIPFIICANICLFNGIKKNQLSQFLFSGILFGCAALVKQHGAFFGIFGFIALLISLWQSGGINKKIYWKHVLIYITGIIIPLFLCFLYLFYVGVLEKFYLWTFTYAKEYNSLNPVRDIRFNIIGYFFPLLRFASLMWIIAGVGFIALFSAKYNGQSCILILGLLIAGIVASSIGFYFRPHYFVLLLPAVALLFGVGIRSIFNFFSNATLRIVRIFPPVFIVSIAILGTIAAHWDVLYQFPPDRVTQTVYFFNPFPYSTLIAKIIREKTTKEDRIAIIGNEPQYLFYSQRRSATSFIYFFSLVEEQLLAEQFRLEMIRQVESTSPKLLVYNQIQPEWYRKSKSMEEIDKWFFNYAEANYSLIARFEYFNLSDTLLVTDPNLLMKGPTHVCWVSIYDKMNK
jgi:hypothetical protein